MGIFWFASVNMPLLFSFVRILCWFAVCLRQCSVFDRWPLDYEMSLQRHFTAAPRDIRWWQERADRGHTRTRRRKACMLCTSSHVALMYKCIVYYNRHGLWQKPFHSLFLALYTNVMQAPAVAAKPTAKYVPPSMREGGNRRGESMNPKGQRGLRHYDPFTLTTMCLDRNCGIVGWCQRYWISF